MAEPLHEGAPSETGASARAKDPPGRGAAAAGEPEAGARLADRPRTRRARLREWFWRGHSLALARAFRPPPLDATRRARAATARSLIAFADAAISPHGPSGLSSPYAAFLLYREAIHLALSAFDPGDAEAPLAAALERCPERVRAFLPESALAALQRELVGRPPHALASEPLTYQIEQAERARRLALGALDTLAPLPPSNHPSVQRALVQRWSRLGALALLVALAALGVQRALREYRFGPDLAKGKGWRVSTSYQGFPSSGTTDMPRKSGPLFHTSCSDDSPWFEIDLGAPTQVSGARVRNRSDCCQERAAPLVLELATEPGAFTKVASVDKIFATWTPFFAPRTARYVRVRATHQTCLHLDKVSVWR